MSSEKKEISMMEMLKSGVHFGHKKSKRHPKMNEHVYTVRNGISIINLAKTKEKLREALDYVEKVSSNDGTVLFVGTKRQAKKIIKDAAIKCGMPYVSERWLGGTFTNFDKIVSSVKRLQKMEKEKENGELEKKYTKRERQEIDREIKKLEVKFGGIRNMGKLPEAVFVVDIQEEQTAVMEAIAKNIPIIAMVDTNVDPSMIDYPIPANDDAIKSIEMIVSAISKEIVKIK